jgi:uncharacterized protein YjiS (DUF1127 family)
MSMTSTFGAWFAPSRRSRLRDSYRSGRRSYRAWRTRRATLQELRSLSDHTLKDIGIHRSELVSVAASQSIDHTRRRRGPRRIVRLDESA